MIKTVEVNHNVVMIWYHRDFYNCPEHIVVKQYYFLSDFDLHISLNSALFEFLLYSWGENRKEWSDKIENKRQHTLYFMYSNYSWEEL